MIASKHGVIRILVAAFRNKHESKIKDFRYLIKMFRAGNDAGDTGTTIFLTKVKRVKSGFTNDFLIKYGSKPGSKIMANTNAFMDT